MPLNHRAGLKRCALAVALVAGAAFLAGALFHAYRERRIASDLRARAERMATTAAARIDERLAATVPLVEALARDLETVAAGDRGGLEALVRGASPGAKGHAGIGVAFAPGQFSAEVRLFGLYHPLDSGTDEFLQIPNDYASGASPYYTLPMTVGATWTEPRFSHITRELVTEYSAPFYARDPRTGERRKAGVVYIALSLAELRAIMLRLGTSGTGYGFLASSSGRFLYHPQEEEYVRGLKGVDVLAAEAGDDRLRAVDAAVRAHRPCSVDYLRRADGRAARVVTAPVSSTGWSFGLDFVPEPTFTEAGAQLTLLEGNLLAAVLALAALILYYYARRPIERDRDLWRAAAGVSLLFLAGICGIWYVEINGMHRERGEGLAFTDPNGLRQFEDDYRRKSDDLRLAAPAFIPTGLFVQSLEFTGANDIKVTGYVWQKFTDRIHDGVARGVIFPESDKDGADIVTEVYRRKSAECETVGWYFMTTLRESFGYGTYPLDQENAWIRLWPTEFYKNVVLVPDLDAYRVMAPDERPGLERSFVLEGWSATETFFNYQYNRYNSNFGIPDFVGADRFPELCYNILLRRNFLNPFIADLLPIIIVAGMLFALLFTISKDDQLRSRVCFNPTDVIASCSALFFCVIVAQIQLRNKIDCPYVIYLEYFYFTTYFLILSVGANALLYSRSDRFRALEYHDNLLPKVLFWPVATGFMLVITALRFLG